MNTNTDLDLIERLLKTSCGNQQEIYNRLVDLLLTLNVATGVLGTLLALILWRVW